jgi:peptidoglycan hydrolase-like protein with peptidoglycan-binding domain
MLHADQIRRLSGLGICALSLSSLFLSMCAATAQTSPEPTEPAQASAATAKKSKKQSAVHAATTKRATSGHASKKARGKRVAKKRGQQGIDSARAREIQEALILQNYMQGEPSGAWDSATQAAMRRYQEDHGWQSKTIPDSRALIRLGLGPSSDHLLNPESAMTARPAAGDPKSDAKQTPPGKPLPQQ